MQPEQIAATIRNIRLQRGLTQAELAERLCLSSKTVSKWETAHGIPDISLLEPLCRVLGVSVAELLAGAPIVNRNTAANMHRCRFSVCPICGNILWSMGDAAVSCCGLPLAPLVPTPVDEAHRAAIVPVEGERYLTVEQHPMEKEHHLSFAALVGFDRVDLVKFYPEGNAQTRLPAGRGILYLYCTEHGLMQQKL